jgi:hypothetical protein
MFPDDDWILVESYNIKMFIFEVTVVLYFIKILSGSCKFYRLRIPVTISCLPIQTTPPPPPPPVNLVLQHCCKALQNLYCTIRTIRRLFADYSYYSSTIRGLFVLLVDYSRTIRTIRRLFAYSPYSLHYSSFINCRKISLVEIELYQHGS